MAEDKRKEIDVTVIEVTEEYLKEKLIFIDNKAKVKSGSEEYYIDINGKRIHN